MKRLLTLSLVVALAACDGIGGSKGSVRSALGINRNAPDEFKVVSRPPLSVPPEFNLRPPKPGAPPTGIASAEKQAEAIVSGEGSVTPVGGFTSLDEYIPQASTTVTPVMASPLESASDANFLSKAGTDIADEDIREKLYSDESDPKLKKPGKYALQNWFGESGEDELVDPKAEAERIRENIDEEKPVNEGEVETIESEPSTLDLLF